MMPPLWAKLILIALTTEARETTVWNQENLTKESKLYLTSLRKKTVRQWIHPYTMAVQEIPSGNIFWMWKAPPITLIIRYAFLFNRHTQSR
jgi:hypothetical protein